MIRASNTPAINTVPGWSVIADLRSQLDALAGRVTAAEGALDRLGFVPCATCGVWMARRQQGEALVLAGTYWCGPCLLGRLAAMARVDGPEWDDFLDPGLGRGITEELARIAKRRDDVWRAACAAWDAIGCEEQFMRLVRELPE